ncbi:MAG: ABC transporter ATP-binding protein [Defluviitaleaceae bacterium]|nr:ABC transporter ATP-binding protein [Defluviitaleaceae bacterium]
MPTPIIQAKNLTKEYIMGEVTVRALRGVSFDLYAGEFIVVLGPSGSGKSTLLNIVGGIDKPTSGEVIFETQDIAQASDKELTAYRRNAVGFVFQFYNLIPNLTARENIKLASEMSKSPICPDELLASVGLSARARNFPTQLSGGEQQRVAIARAVSKNPSILLCDEPTGALDFETGIQVLRILKDFNQQYGKTVIIITHNASIGAMGNRVFYFKDGLIDKIVTNEKPVNAESVSW